jgi:hypothetical protein
MMFDLTPFEEPSAADCQTDEAVPKLMDYLT